MNNQQLSIGQHLDQAVSKHKTQIAIKDSGGSYTYQDVKEISDRICTYLIQHDLKKGDIVGLVFEQSKECVAATIGVLKAGCSFVPLDVNDPITRLATIIEDCKPTILIHSVKHETIAAELNDNHCLIRCFSTLISDQNTAIELPEVSPDDRAYIFYTSGTTGEPKGVCQTHRNLLHFIAQYSSPLKITSSDKLSMLYSLNFSASNMDVFSSLLNGASLHFYNIKERGASKLNVWLKQEKITVLHTVPTVFRYLLKNSPPDQNYHSIRAIDLGGEALYASDVQLFRQHFSSDTICVNHLAATEASVIAQHVIEPNRDYAEGNLTVGQPAPGIEIRILNENGVDIEPGETGQIVIKSSYLSPEYYNKPKLTNSLFSDSGDIDFCRAYKSGDLGYRDKEGNLFFVGRSDDRVKIRGHSVATGEIESTLIGIKGIENVVVVSKTNHSMETMLVAFLVPTLNTNHSEKSIRDFINKQLPDYMVPGAIMFRKSLPLTLTGKVDRRLLAQEYLVDDTPVSTDDLPQNTIEQRIAEMFSVILQCPTVARNQEFFDLGGNSMGMAQLIAEIEKQFNIEIPLEFIAKECTVCFLAQHVEKSVGNVSLLPDDTTPSLIIPLRVKKQTENLFLVHGRLGHAFISPYFADILGEKHSLYAIRARGLKYGEQPNTDITAMATDYINEITQLQPRGPYYLAAICAGSVIAIEMANLLKQKGHIVAPIISIDPPILTATNPEKLEKKLTRLKRDLNRKEKNNPNFERKLQKRNSQGNVKINLINQQSISLTHKTVLSFEIAIASYQPQPHNNEVLLLSSMGRILKRESINDSYSTNNNLVFCVAKNHRHSLNPRTDQMAITLRECIGYAQNRVSSKLAQSRVWRFSDKSGLIKSGKLGIIPKTTFRLSRIKNNFSLEFKKRVPYRIKKLLQI